MSGTNQSSSADENGRQDDEQQQQQQQQQQQGDEGNNRPHTRKPQHHGQQEKATNALLRLLSTEIAKDGGASLVTSLKDYFATTINGKRFNALLTHAIGHAKLLRFLEVHSEVFNTDRHASPHVVHLLSRQYVVDEDLISDAKWTKDKLLVVRNKASYVLQKRQAKLNRRKKKQESMDIVTENDTTYAANDTTTANLPWLLQQSVGDVHLYLRASGFYVRTFYETASVVETKETQIQIPLVGSRAWQDLVLEEFGAILKADPESRFVIGTFSSSNDGGSPKVWLSHLDPNAATVATKIADGTFSLKNNNNGSVGVETEAESSPFLDEQYLDTLDECLVRLVHQDGGHEVRLELLLHRHLELKMALGGRDFSTIYEKCQDRLESSDISCRKEGVDWIFASNRTAAAKYGGGGRMVVDKVGLYSVTNSKWGTAIGNIMVQCCKTTAFGNTTTKLSNYGTTSDGDNDTATNSSKPILVDMTASVGGMTLGLAKTEYFDQILAYEMDPERAKLCQTNMKRHGVDHLVEVRNQDSVEALSSFLPCKEHQYCFVVDPPWGGVAYKQKTRRYSQFFMGPWSLKDVLVRMYIHCKPCLVGMRLPQDKAKVNELLDELRQENLRFETKTLRQLSVQRFVVLHFLPD
ncbi:unnamed protein product [Cylindrotheca closterium]|uniref:Trimethylguanosine synthase n=1 Tax=Cylindrotheca closterium TaxID=2856 RepID=A0AAD2JPR3_9STRA|nr:unnamed protein product [Cylindrotheca closterium]